MMNVIQFYSTIAISCIIIIFVSEVSSIIIILHACISHVYYSDFHVWTFAYDVSGISSVVFNYRKDMDGINPLQDNSNEVYKSGQSHGIYWRSKDCVCSAHHVLVLQCLFLEKVRYWLRLGQLISDTTIPVDYTTKKPTTHC